MGLIVYTLGALASLACAIMLWRGYRQSHARLLLWSALCFAFLALNNALLVLNVRVLPSQDLSVVRSIPSLIGVALLLYGLIWESDR